MLIERKWLLLHAMLSNGFQQWYQLYDYAESCILVLNTGTAVLQLL